MKPSTYYLNKIEMKKYRSEQLKITLMPTTIKNSVSSFLHF